MATTRLTLTREQVLAHRRRVTHLDERLPPGPDSLRRAAVAGLSDSMPRAAVLSLHARVGGVAPGSWEDPALVQLWGPRFSVYAVAAPDRAVFTVGRSTAGSDRLVLGEELADRLEAALQGERVPMAEAARAIGVGHPNALRYAAPTGRLLVRWDGARQPHVWIVPRPDTDPDEARLELVRRYLHALGPGTPAGFGDWAGARPAPARTRFEALRDELVPVTTPVGEAWVLAADEASFREPAGPPAPVRLLPSGDTFFLLQGEDRTLLVPDADQRAGLWPSRVWPGALLLDGDVAGTWRRSQHVVRVHPWVALTAVQRAAVAAEAASLPLPGLDRDLVVHWEGASGAP